MELKVAYRYAKIAPRKARLVVDLIRGASVDEAFNTLRLTRKRASPMISKLLKSAVARWCYQNRCPSFAWQPRYYDRILRDEPSLIRAREYVANNPLGWEADRDKPEGLWI